MSQKHHLMPAAADVASTDLFLVNQRINGTWRFRKINRDALAALMAASTDLSTIGQTGFNIRFTDGQLQIYDTFAAAWRAVGCFDGSLTLSDPL